MTQIRLLVFCAVFLLLESTSFAPPPATRGSEQDSIAAFRRQFQLDDPSGLGIDSWLSTIDTVALLPHGTQPNLTVGVESVLRRVLLADREQFLALRPTAEQLNKYVLGISPVRVAGRFQVFTELRPENKDGLLALLKHGRDSVVMPVSQYEDFFHNWMQQTGGSDRDSDELKRWLGEYKRRYDRDEITLIRSLDQKWPLHLSLPYGPIARALDARVARQWIEESIHGRYLSDRVNNSLRANDNLISRIEKLKPVLGELYERDPSLRKEDLQHGGIMGAIKSGYSSLAFCRRIFARVGAGS